MLFVLKCKILFKMPKKRKLNNARNLRDFRYKSKKIKDKETTATKTNNGKYIHI